jgi:hypothetical protein
MASFKAEKILGKGMEMDGDTWGISICIFGEASFAEAR